LPPADGLSRPNVGRCPRTLRLIELDPSESFDKPRPARSRSGVAMSTAVATAADVLDPAGRRRESSAQCEIPVRAAGEEQDGIVDQCAGNGPLAAASPTKSSVWKCGPAWANRPHVSERPAPKPFPESLFRRRNTHCHPGHSKDTTVETLHSGIRHASQSRNRGAKITDWKYKRRLPAAGLWAPKKKKSHASHTAGTVLKTEKEKSSPPTDTWVPHATVGGTAHIFYTYD